VVDVALYEAVFAMMESLVPEYDHDGFVRERSGNIMPGITPSNTHSTRDGQHVTIGANGDAIFQRLMRAMGRADLADDPNLADNAGRDARRSELYALIDQWVAEQDYPALMQRLAEAEVPASKVYSIADMFADPHFQAREMFIPLTLPDGKVIRMPGIVPKLLG
jgi:formyl-CoA transferase